MISANSRKNTVNDTRIEMQSVTWNESLIVAIRINDSLIEVDGYRVMLTNKKAIMSKFTIIGGWWIIKTQLPSRPSLMANKRPELLGKWCQRTGW